MARVWARRGDGVEGRGCRVGEGREGDREGDGDGDVRLAAVWARAMERARAKVVARRGEGWGRWRRATERARGGWCEATERARAGCSEGDEEGGGSEGDGEGER